jgi:hypothetical protein
VKRVILIFCFSLIALPAFLQVVNIEKIRKNPESKGFHGLLELSFNAIQSEDDIVQFKTKTSLGYIRDKNTYLFFNDISLGKLNAENFVNNGFLHFRYNRLVIDNILNGESFVQFQYNSVRKLSQRWLIGLGPRFSIFDKDSLKIFAGPLSMLEYEILTDNTQSSCLRMSSYVSFFIKLKNGISINHMTYYQPVYSDFSDYRFSTETQFVFQITNNFSFKTIFALSYDSSPPEGIRNRFYNLENGIALSL